MGTIVQANLLGEARHVNRHPDFVALPSLSGVIPAFKNSSNLVESNVVALLIPGS